MYSAEDLFTHEDNENDIERIVEDHTEPQDDLLVTEEKDGDNEDDGENDSKKEVKAKRVVRNPQPKLNEERLRGPRGLNTLEKVFERVKFKGPGHEEDDLNVLLKTYEYWCHRLFPKYPFDDCVEKIEKLGHKKAVQTYVKKIRLGMMVDEEDKAIINSDEDMDNDQVISEGISQQNDPFNQFQPTVESNSENVDLTDEQLERIRENKLKAWTLRQEKLRKIQEKAEQNITTSQTQSLSSGSNDLTLVNNNENDDDGDNTLVTTGAENDEMQQTSNISVENRESANEDEEDIENILNIVNDKDNGNEID